jgi:hypothetical protein
MIGFEMLLGHLVGDYVIQNTYMATRKTKESLPCLVHCICYTFAIFALCWAWFPWWGYLVVFGLHFPIDRWRLATWWMEHGPIDQKLFASQGAPFWPWSVIMVDNIWHLLTLYGVAKCAGY